MAAPDPLAEMSDFLLHRGRRPYMALNAVCCETALRPKLRDEPTLRGRRKSVVRDPKATWPKSFFAEPVPFLSSALRHLFTIAEPC
jgi:hypothetical protein